MKGYKNSTKTVYETESSANYAKGGTAKVGKVMGEFKQGTLHSGSKKGPEVTSRKQAVAIGLSEARKAGAKLPLKKADGGLISPLDLTIPTLRTLPSSDKYAGYGSGAPTSTEPSREAAMRADPRLMQAYKDNLYEDSMRESNATLDGREAMRDRRGVRGPVMLKAKGGIVEKSSGEVYASKGAMLKHEAKESKAKERTEQGKTAYASGGYVKGHKFGPKANLEPLISGHKFKNGGKVGC